MLAVMRTMISPIPTMSWGDPAPGLEARKQRAESQIRRYTSRFNSAVSPMKRNRFAKRIAAARARLLAIKLSNP